MADRAEQVTTSRELVGRWALGVLMGLGALTLLLRPGVISKLIALVLAGGAVAMFARRNRGDATVVAVVLLLVGGAYLALAVTGNSHLITDRYR